MSENADRLKLPKTIGTFLITKVNVHILSGMMDRRIGYSYSDSDGKLYKTAPLQLLPIKAGAVQGIMVLFLYTNLFFVILTLTIK